MYHADVDSKLLQLKSSKKSNEMEIHNILHYKTILWFEIYTELLFLHAFTGCNTTSSIYGVGKATIFKNLISNKHLQEVALVLTTSSRSYEEIQLETKQCLLFSREIATRLSILYATNDLLRKKLQLNILSSRKYYLQPNQLKGTIVFEHIFRWCSGTGSATFVQ